MKLICLCVCGMCAMLNGATILQVILEAMGTPRPIMLQTLLTLDMALIKYVI